MKMQRPAITMLLAVLAVSSSPSGWCDEFNWDGNTATLEQLLQYVKSETGKRFVYKPEDLAGKKVTILAPDFDKSNLMPLFEAVLEMQALGLAATGDERGEVYKVVPVQNLKSQPLPIFTPDDMAKLPLSDRLVTQVLTLKHIDPAQVGPILNDLTHIPTSSIKPIPNTNVVVITDYASNMPRLAKIIQIMDQQNAPPKIEIYPLKYSSSADLAPRLNTLLNGLNSGRRAGPGGPGPPGQAPALVTDDPRTNAIIVIGSEDDQRTIQGLIERLDADLGADQNTIQFFPVQHRNAKELADIIKAMYTEVQTAQREAQTAAGPGARPGAPAPPPSAGSTDSAIGVLPRIVADESTNALIAIGPPRSFKELKATVERLDTRRPQVFIEATIMEVGESATRQLGLQLASVEEPNGGTSFFGGTNWGFTTPSAANPTESTLNATQGLVAGVFKDTTKKIPVILKALQSNNDADVIATPSLMTNDNQKATVTISDQQPTTTTQTGTATTNTTFNTFVSAETKLDITPHISTQLLPDGRTRPYLRLEITQTLEKFVGASTTAGVPPPKESRTTTTTVTIPDGGTVVISGFTRKDRRSTVNKVPLLGDLPLLGRLFRNSDTVDVKTNLFLFVTPHILMDFDQLENLDRSLKSGREWDDLEKTLRERYFSRPREDEKAAP